MANAAEGGGPVERRTSGLAIASLVLGVLGLVPCGLGLLGIPGLVLGLVALSKIHGSRGRLGGKGLAIGGVVTGGLSLILVPLLIIVAIAIPGMVPDRKASNEWAAIANLRTYATAQNIYRRTDHDGDGVYEYAHPYVRLNTDEVDGVPIRLIDDALANASRDDPPGGATAPKRGYVFVDIVADERGEDYDDGEGNLVEGFGLCAVPAEHGRTGRNTFIIGVDCTVYQKDTGGEPVTRCPSLDEGGWVPAGY